jgi:anti-anti-sigma factor
VFRITSNDPGTIVLVGRLDAAQAPVAQDFLDTVCGDCVLDLEGLEYISSAGLGVLLRTLKRLMASGHRLKLIQVNRHIRDIFTYSGFDKLFDIEPANGAESRP